jgi:hypothetical protein
MYIPSHRPSKTFCNPCATPTLKYVLKTCIAYGLLHFANNRLSARFAAQKDTRMRCALSAHTRIEIARDEPTCWPTRPHAPMMSGARCHMKAAAETRSIKSRRGFWPSLRGRFGPHPHNVSLQNLQGDPGTTIYVCAIEENPRQKIRSARHVSDALNPCVHRAAHGKREK